MEQTTERHPATNSIPLGIPELPDNASLENRKIYLRQIATDAEWKNSVEALFKHFDTRLAKIETLFPGVMEQLSIPSFPDRTNANNDWQGTVESWRIFLDTRLIRLETLFSDITKRSPISRNRPAQAKLN
jgi:hypothetical protein